MAIAEIGNQIARVTKLRANVRGQVLEPGDDGYDEARLVYNAMIDRRPGVVVRCQDVADVVAGVNFAREIRADLSIRSGAHNVAGFGTNDDGVVLDLSLMNHVRIDRDRLVAYVAGGATWGDVDHAAWGFGLATPGGIISTTGVAGLGLGGGFGYLTRQFGLVVDNILSADVVTATGDLVHASPEQHPDLFWALRGGGGNFGMVVGLELRLHKVPELYGGPIFYPVSESEKILKFYREFIKSAPRELSAFFGIHVAPPAPFVPEHLHGHTACVIVVSYTGPGETAEEMVRPIREAGKVALDLAGPIPYPALNSLFDDVLPHGLHHYWKSNYANELTDAAIEVHKEFGPEIPSALSLMHIYPLNGAVQDVEPDATAFAHRDVGFSTIIAGIGTDGRNMPANRDWVRGYWSALQPHSTESAYVNFLMEEGQDRIRSTFGGNYFRLQQIKRIWDPTNLFHMNQNIRPASEDQPDEGS
jgi:hypothetical protein